MTKKRPIRLVLADMDGTLLNDEGEVTPATSEAIRAVQQRGIVFAACTGRFPENAAITIRDGGIDCPIIALNGGCITEKTYGRLITSHPMPKGKAVDLFHVLEGLEVPYYMFGNKAVYARDPAVPHHSIMKYGNRLVREADVRYYYGPDACRNALAEDMYKYYIYTKPGLMPLDDIKKALEPIQGVALTQSSETNIEVMPEGIDKGTGAKELAEYFGIKKEETMAIGDQDNDIPMLMASGFAVAMGNAASHVFEHADAVTKSNADDGVAYALKTYIS